MPLIRPAKLLSVLAFSAVFGSCAGLPTPDARAPAPQDPGLVLRGRVVTMNDRDEVIQDGRVWVRNGRIESVLRASDPLPAAAAGARSVDTGGVIYPGLIDIHNHPEYAAFPLMPLKRRYADRYEWRFYDEDYTRRITNANVVVSGADFLALGSDMGRYGEFMALAGGTTSLQGGGTGPSPGTTEVHGRHFRPHAMPGCLVRNVETETLGDLGRQVRSAVDMGRDVPEWERLRLAVSSGPLILHLAEGVSRRMADEFRSIRNSGLLNANLVVVHGVGLDASHFEPMAKAGAKLAWSPLSNFMLYGKTADVRAAHAAGVEISLTPDWAPSGSKSLLGELKVADRVNRHALKGLFSDRDLVRMATRHPASALGWQGVAGQVAPGFVADLLVVDGRHDDPYRNLIQATEREVRATVVRGDALFGDTGLVRSLRGGDTGLEALSDLLPREKSLAPQCEARDAGYREVTARLAKALAFDGAYTLERMGGPRVAQELTRCPAEPPVAQPPTPGDAARMLKCRFGLPFETTPLMGLTTVADGEYWKRYATIPHLPDFLKTLQDDFR
ncbi:MAG: amidohydrolase family protein [Betaproteobacteria bacterium]|nr:amidohydrolase family protein [Betaproteobacteria bacterium]